MTDQPPVYIRSTLDEDGKAACLMQWGPIEKLLAPKVVLTTARDLMAAAAAAETDIALIQSFREDIGADDQVLAAALDAVRRRRPHAPGKAALQIAAVAGAMTGRPYVHIRRGSLAGQLDPDEARAMAQRWIETATAAAIDVRLRYALGEWDHLLPTDIERLFTIIQKLGSSTP